jgi:hypothetical protein
MKRFSTLVLMTIIAATPLCVLPACSETVYHHDQTKTNWDGSRTRSETTVRRNPDGTTTTDTDKVRVRD